MELQDFEESRNKMVETQLKARGIRSEAVLNAMRAVPRHLFVPEALQGYAYADSPLAIGAGQTISQPYIVAFMTEQLEPAAFAGKNSCAWGSPDGSKMKILEIGAGSAYQTAILAYLGCEVYSIELIEGLATTAKKTLADLNFNNVHIRHGNGYLGWEEEAPFDAVIVTAAPDAIPEKLFEQLKEGGKMIVPVGPVNSTQSLKLIVKKNAKAIEKDLILVRFVPMLENAPVGV
jgi:protein-L-isoaspartate(D-aspartate) O-methyltransferase